MTDLPVQTLLWLGAAILLGLLEILSPGYFFFIFFAFGALIAAVSSIWSGSVYWDGAIFIGTSLLFIAIARPFFRRILNIGDKPQHLSNVDALIGMDVLILEPVDRLQGKVKVTHTGEVWSAYTEADAQSLPVDTLGVIEKIDGAKLVIAPK